MSFLFRLRPWLFSFVLLVATNAPYRAANIPPATEYRAIADSLTAFIRSEMVQKQIPAISIALIDDQRIVWSAGFGNALTNMAASADTIYRVGSVSKLFTDIAVMQLVERGALDLDAPITKYLPAFRPKNPFNKEIQPITLRHLMAHRSGLCRETPVGSYFDPAEPSLADTIASLNQTELTYEPGTRLKYSNAAIALVGYLLERHERKPFAECIQRLLAPLRIEQSSFTRTPAVNSHLADGLMWTVHGRTFKAPPFEIGIAPAACMYSSVNDLGRFMTSLFARESSQVLKPETWEQMFSIQFAEPGQKQGFGLGFSISEVDGERAVGHNGAMYGFATQFTGLIDAKLGVVVIASKDFVNTVTGRIATRALQSMLAQKKNKPLPDFAATEPLDRATILALAGHYTAGDRSLELRPSGTNLFLLWNTGGYQHTVRKLGDHFITDGPLGHGQTIEITDHQETAPSDKTNDPQAKKSSGSDPTSLPLAASLRIADKTYHRATVGPHATLPQKWRGLIGEYGWDHNVLYILERDGQLWALIEWFEFNPLTQLSENVFAFPNRGLYHGEKLVFKRDANDRATEVTAASVTFPRRNIGPQPDASGGAQTRLKPTRPIAELRAEALAAQPPAETNRFRAPDLVELTADPAFRFDVRYARADNFLGTPFYTQPRVFLQRPAAEALSRAQAKLKEKGYGLTLFDGYRPWHITKTFWDATPRQHKWLVADPSEGSRHNRGCAIDLTLCDPGTGGQLQMPGTYDEPTDRSYPDYPGGTSLERGYRDLLRDFMESEGFTVYPEEWWHFDYKDWREYPIMNMSFEKVIVKQ